MKKILLCFTVLVMSLFCFQTNVSADMSEDVWNHGEQIEGLEVVEFEFGQKNSTIEADSDTIDLRLKFNKEIDPDYNVSVYSEKQDDVLEAKLDGVGGLYLYSFGVERSEEDPTVYSNDGEIVHPLNVSGKYKITYVLISRDPEDLEGKNSQQLIKLDKSISDENNFSIHSPMGDGLRPTIKSITTDKDNYKVGDTAKVTVKTQLPEESSDVEMDEYFYIMFGMGEPYDGFMIAGKYLEMELKLQSDGTTYYGEAKITDWFTDGNFKLQQLNCNSEFKTAWGGGLVPAKYGKSVDLTKTYFTIGEQTGETGKPSEPEAPNVPEVDNKTVIENINKAVAGETVKVDMKKETTLSKDVISAIKGKDVNLVLNMSGYSWTINGKTVTSDVAKDINMGVNFLAKNIASNYLSVMENRGYTRQLSLSHNGDFGFEASLQINFTSDYKNKNSKLYYFNNGSFEHMMDTKIDANGNATYKFTHASDYVILVEKEETKKAPVQTSDNTQVMYLSVASMISLVAGVALYSKLKKRKSH